MYIRGNNNNNSSSQHSNDDNGDKSERIRIVDLRIPACYPFNVLIKDYHPHRLIFFLMERPLFSNRVPCLSNQLNVSKSTLSSQSIPGLIVCPGWDHL